MTVREELYNGINIQKPWPPRMKEKEQALKKNIDRIPETICYLSNPPKVIPIHVGRQLFVDDFLIDTSTLQRKYYYPEPYVGNPILKPQTKIEKNEGCCPVAATFTDGVFYDSKDGLYKMWYQAGWFDGTAYAESLDGQNWYRPDLDVVPGTNMVLPFRKGYKRDGATVWIDHETKDPKSRYKLFVFFRKNEVEEIGELYISSDGIHWNGPTITGPCGDASSFFYNPFRKKWVFSIRKVDVEGDFHYRYRQYYETEDFLKGADWGRNDPVFWYGADDLDKKHAIYDCTTQLYGVDCVAYESILLGAFEIFKGPHNRIAEELGVPKQCDITLGYSRDGFHFCRPDRTAFLKGSEKKGTWDYGYIHASGGLCIVEKDQLRFYYSAWSGESPKYGKHMYAGGATGYATLRRDGFASVAAEKEGFLKTRVLVFKGEYLWLNTISDLGEVRVEVRTASDEPINGFRKEECEPVITDSTKVMVRWSSGNSLKQLEGKPIKFVFWIRKAEVFSFWVSDDERGKSRGYMGAGSTNCEGIRDI